MIYRHYLQFRYCISMFLSLWTLITIVATLGQTLPSLTDSAFVVMDLTCQLGYENNWNSFTPFHPNYSALKGHQMWHRYSRFQASDISHTTSLLHQLTIVPMCISWITTTYILTPLGLMNWAIDQKPQ